jgi:Fic family protein
VLTLRSKPQFNPHTPSAVDHLDVVGETTTYTPPVTLNTRQKEVLAVFLKHEFVGPQLVVQILGVSLATAHRDLEMLERSSLVERTKNRKRTLSQAGFDYVDYLSAL